MKPETKLLAHRRLDYVLRYGGATTTVEPLMLMLQSYCNAVRNSLLVKAKREAEIPAAKGGAR